MIIIHEHDDDKPRRRGLDWFKLAVWAVLAVAVAAFWVAVFVLFGVVHV